MADAVLSRQWRTIRVLSGVLGVLAALVSYEPSSATPKDDPPPDVIEELQVAQIVMLSQAEIEEQEVFYRRELEPDLIALRTYPVASLRPELNEVLDLLLSDKIVFAHQGDYSWNTSFALAFTSRMPAPDGRPLIVFELKPLYAYYPTWEEEGILQDTLAEILLHEYFHVRHHVGGLASRDTLERFRHDESEAWFYTCDSVLRPMLEAGRFPKGNMNAAAGLMWNAYALSGGDPTSLVWRNAIIQLHPTLPPSE